MNEQQQVERRLDLDTKLATIRSAASKTSKLGDNTDVEASRAKGMLFALALKAKFDGARPIGEDLIFATVDLANIKVGKSFVQIQHQCKPDARRKPYYATTITNLSSERVRIDRFGTYIQKGRVLVLHSITGGYFNGQQFREWYELDDEWLEPGQVVTDPNNHSQVGVFWAYFGTTASGKQFVAGAAWNGKRWWQ